MTTEKILTWAIRLIIVGLLFIIISVAWGWADKFAGLGK